MPRLPLPLSILALCCVGTSVAAQGQPTKPGLHRPGMRPRTPGVAPRNLPEANKTRVPGAGDSTQEATPQDLGNQELKNQDPEAQDPVPFGTRTQHPRTFPETKDSNTFLNPTPRSLWRPLSQDRPTVTESPITVDAGARQIEVSFFDIARDGDNDSYAFASFNAKVGVDAYTDLQLLFTPYTRAETVDGGSDVTIRVKRNLYGNEGGDEALAVIPFITFPTGARGLSAEDIQAGLILTGAWTLDGATHLGAEIRGDAVSLNGNGNYGADFTHSVVVSHALTEDVGLWVEYAGIIRSGSRSYVAIGDAGVSFPVNENLVFDTIVSLGLSSSAPDFGLGAGVTFRF